MITNLLADGSIILVMRKLAVIGPASATIGHPGADLSTEVSEHFEFPLINSETKLWLVLCNYICKTLNL